MAQYFERLKSLPRLIPKPELINSIEEGCELLRPYDPEKVFQLELDEYNFKACKGSSMDRVRSCNARSSSNPFGPPFGEQTDITLANSLALAEGRLKESIQNKKAAFGPDPIEILRRDTAKQEIVVKQGDVKKGHVKKGHVKKGDVNRKAEIPTSVKNALYNWESSLKEDKMAMIYLGKFIKDWDDAIERQRSHAARLSSRR
ncbi:hypothetical protein F4779DRAFT_584307 [Xylariaceae sp. FL0662B]|nr:hypothetical protein F4779DRAFT_584307 [Xylariaceae sp. FL0662B]